MTGSSLRQRAQNQGNGGGQEVATRQPSSIAGVIQQMVPEIQRALPRHLNSDRMARMALTEIRKNPDLARSDPKSFAGALLTAAALGLEVGTGEAYLVPYEHRRGALAGTVECQFIVGYQGMAKLFWQSPMAKHLDAQAVFANDDFDYAYGLGQFLRHKPATGDRGQVIAYYAVAELTTGGSAFVVLTPDEVKALRGGKEGPSGRIPDPQRWMERKTALRQLLKTLPRSATLTTAIDADEKGGAELYRQHVEATQVVQTPNQPGQEDQQRQLPPAGASSPGGTGGLSDSQRTKLHATLQEIGISDRDRKLDYCSDIIGRPVESTNDLTVSEASQIIDLAERYGTEIPQVVGDQGGQGHNLGVDVEDPPYDEPEWPPTAEIRP